MTTLTFKRKSNLHPTAAKAEALRKRVGDKSFPAFADKMIAGVKNARDSRESEKSIMGSFNKDGSYNKPKK